MLTATPGRGRITRVTLATLNGDESGFAPARVVPHLNRHHHGNLDAEPEQAGLVPVVSKVDVVLPHATAGEYATGLVVSFVDADAARAFGRAAYRASALLAQEVPASALESIDRPGADLVADLPTVTVAGQEDPNLT